MIKPIAFSLIVAVVVGQNETMMNETTPVDPMMNETEAPMMVNETEAPMMMNETETPMMMNETETPAVMNETDTGTPPLVLCDEFLGEVPCGEKCLVTGQMEVSCVEDVCTYNETFGEDISEVNRTEQIDVSCTDPNNICGFGELCREDEECVGSRLLSLDPGSLCQPDSARARVVNCRNEVCDDTNTDACRASDFTCVDIEDECRAAKDAGDQLCDEENSMKEYFFKSDSGIKKDSKFILCDIDCANFDANATTSPAPVDEPTPAPVIDITFIPTGNPASGAIMASSSIGAVMMVLIGYLMG